MRRALFITYFLFATAACGGGDGDDPIDDVIDPDPLEVTTEPAAGSLDDIYARVIAKRCSGQPGLCHNGQFEPNLSTPGLTYSYLVNRPGIEKPTLLRVKPGDASASLFIDKIRNRNGVATQMPLGAEPLSEEDMQALEKWINDGALRAPGAAPAPVLNNPPKRPQIGIFNASNTRLDGTGPVSVPAGTALVLRHTVNDFETADASVPFGAFILSIGDGRNVVIATGNDPHVGPTTFEAGGPGANGDTFNWRRDWTIPAQLQVRDGAGVLSMVPASGQVISILAIYVDGLPMAGGMVAIETSTTTINVQ
jgi:hypothetical protein